MYTNSLERSIGLITPDIMTQTNTKLTTRITGIISKWVRELRSECSKIVWPTRKQTTKYLLTVIAFVLFIGVLVWAADILFGFGVQAAISALT